MEPPDDRVELIARRSTVLAALADGPSFKRDLIDRLDVSRSTVDRAVEELREAELCRRTDGGFELTLTGRLLLERHREYLESATATLDAGDVLAPLPADTEIDVAALVGAEVHAADATTPYQPLEPLHDAIEVADRYRGLLPALEDPRHVRLLYEHVVVEANDATLVVDDDLHERLRSEYPRRLDAMADAGRFEVFVGSTPPYGLVLTEADGEPTVSLVVFGSDGGVRGVIQNDSPGAVAWAEDRFERARTDANVQTPQRRTNGGTATNAGGSTRSNARLRTALEAAGFVQLDTDYFADRPTADPLSVWRAGLDLPEVYTGYAVDRTRDVDGEYRSLTDDLVDRLEARTDCALVGPAGCGKSTVLKQVATAWYIEDLGPVLYRPSDRGRTPVDADSLVAAVERTDGHALVAVEDAVRPDARGVFEAMQELAGRADVAFLLDAREHEWHDPPAEPLATSVEPVRADYVDVVTMPPLHERDCRALIAKVQRTTGLDISIPTDQFCAVLDDRDDRPGTVLWLLHRVSSYLDPLAEGETTLEEHVQSVHGALDEAGDAVLDAGVLISILNAASLGVTAPLVSALLDGAVDERLEALEGRLLFGEADGYGTYRTPHESWTVEFLAQTIEAEGRAVAEDRFGRCATALFELANEPGRLEAPDVPVGADGGAALRRAPGQTDGWLSTVTTQVFTLGVRHPKLAPLFGETGDSSISLPSATSDHVDHRCQVWRGRMNVAWGDYDRAAREFRGLLDRVDSTRSATASLRVQALLGLADVKEARGDYEAVVELATDAIDVAQSNTNEASAVQARVQLGRAYRETGDLEAAVDQLERALERARETGRLSTECDALCELGEVETYRRAFEAAARYKREAFELARQLADRERQLSIAGRLGIDYSHMDDLSAAREWMHRSLDLSRAVGNRSAAAEQLMNLGHVDLISGRYDDASDRLMTALAIYRDLGHSSGEAEVLGELANVHYNAGDHEAAAGVAREALDAFADIGNPQGWIGAKLTLAQVARERENLTAAERYARAALERSEAAGDPGYELTSRRILGAVKREQGAFEAAEPLLTESRAMAVEVGSGYSIAWADMELAELARARDDAETARDRFREAAEAFDHHGATRDRVAAIEGLVDASAAAGDRDTALEWCELAVEVAEEYGFDQERERLADRRTELDESNAG